MSARVLVVLGALATSVSPVAADTRFGGGNAAALRFARSYVAGELKSIRAGDVRTLKVHYGTKQDRVTDGVVAAARDRLAGVGVETLVDAVTEAHGDLKLVTKTGHVLAVFEEADGMWYVDRLWFACASDCAWK